MTNLKEYFGNISMSKKNKKISLSIFASLLLTAAVIGTIVGVNENFSRKNSIDMEKSPSHAIIKSSCSSTLYPELCYSEITKKSKNKKNIKSQKNVIEASLNLTITAVEHNFFRIVKLYKKKGLSRRQKIALHDCLETVVDDTLDDLYEVLRDLEKYPNKKSLSRHADDLKTLISAAITDQETCIDGLSQNKADKQLRKVLLKGQKHVEKMCSNALAMIKNMTDTDIANDQKLTGNRKLKEEDAHGDQWPLWLSVGDRRLLQSSSVKPDVVVAADGSGNFKTVSAAVAAAPEKSSKRYVIHIKAGVYREKVEVPKKKTNIMFIGDGRSRTIITGNRNVMDGDTTFHSATVAVVGERFLARDITFENTAGPSKHQAVALRVGADFSAFYRCGFLAYQDTLYVHSNRQYFVKCLIAGTVDFIFGNSAAVFQDCDIHARRPNKGQKNMITAQGRTDPNQNTGIVLQKCRIGSTSDLTPVKKDFPTYLGRPWKEYSRTVVMKSTISDVVHPAGWHEWTGDFALNTLYYGEYDNTGAGAATSGRVKWRGFRVIKSVAEAQDFTPARFISAASWLGSTGFPHSLSL